MRVPLDILGKLVKMTSVRATLAKMKGKGVLVDFSVLSSLTGRFFSICSMKDGSFHCDCEVGYGGETCQLTPCSTCAAWDLIGPTGDNHETYSQRNSYCDEIGWDFTT